MAAFLLSVQFNGSIGKIAQRQTSNVIANKIEFYSWVKCPLGFCGKQNRNKSCGYPFVSSVFFSSCFSKRLSLLCFVFASTLVIGSPRMDFKIRWKQALRGRERWCVCVCARAQRPQVCVCGSVQDEQDKVIK